MVKLVEVECGKCGCIFGMTEHFNAERRRDKATWYCPNGHSRAYIESTEDVLRRERDRLKQRLAEKEDDIRRQRERREAAERSASAYKGQATKLRKRAIAGVCPCCNRTFQQLARHMASQHPSFSPEPQQEGATLQ